MEAIITSGAGLLLMGVIVSFVTQLAKKLNISTYLLVLIFSGIGAVIYYVLAYFFPEQLAAGVEHLTSIALIAIGAYEFVIKRFFENKAE